MCGRFSLTTQEEQINQRFNTFGSVPPYIPRFNCAPSQILPVITNQHRHTLTYMQWGLIPYWTKFPDKEHKPINARCESIAQKISFKEALSQRRCIIPADGFFEWKKSSTTGHHPYRITLLNEQLFAMAGLWNQWTGSNGQIRHSFTIITTPANEVVRSIHQRMPAILLPHNEQLWLNETSLKNIDSMLQPYPANQMKIYPVSQQVNSTANDTADIIIPLSENLLF